jgi:CheY-like chemotaxis protein
MKIRAFVFDDNKQVRELVSELLKNKGYEVYDFSEPGICPIFLDQNCPCPFEHACTDFIITDLNMPIMTGLEFIKNQKDYGCKAENIAILSGAWSDSELKFAKELGYKTFNKPIQFQEFYSWLDECEKNINPNRKLSDWFKYKKEKVSST